MISATGESPIERILSCLEGIEERGGYYTALCPAHEDHNPSLSIKAGDDGRVLLKCHAGCAKEEVLAGLGLQWQDLYPDQVENQVERNGQRTNSKPKQPRRVVSKTSWEILDEGGKLHAVHHRTDYEDGEKNISWSSPDEDGRMKWNLQGRSTKDLPLYRSEYVRAWPGDVPVVLVEGEKAADALCTLYQAVLGTVTGASSAPGAEALEVLRGRRVILWPDNDGAGRDHMRKVGKGLTGVASEIRFFEWEDSPDKGDAADHPAVISGDTQPEAVRDLIRQWSEAPFLEAVNPDEENDEATNEATKPAPPSKAPTQAESILGYAESADLFHAPDGKCFATIPVGDHRETWPLKHRQFTKWLTRQFYLETGKAPSAQALTDARATIAARATYDGERHRVFTRVAGDGDTVYLDLCNEAWEVVEITSEGWRVLSESPVKFVRKDNSAAPLPRPEPGGDVQDLRPFLNVSTEEDFRLIVAWLVGALNPDGPYPLLILQGEQGSAKSTTVRVLRSLVDPAVEPLRTPPRNEHDLAITASGNWIPALDNLSGIKDWLSDALCRLSTGGGFATRELYSDDGEVLFSAKRPVILNGIDSLAVAGDLRDRSIIVELPTIPATRKRTERDLVRARDAAIPGILGALLNAVSASLKGRDTTKLSELPRLADFAVWVVSAEDALGWKRGTFISAYTGNRSEANELALDDDPVAVAVREMMENREEWSGFSGELLEELSSLVDESVTRSKASWPVNPRSLSDRMKRLAPGLREVGIQYDGTPKAGGSRTRRLKTLKKVPVILRPDSPDSPGEYKIPAKQRNKAGLSGDGGDGRPTVTTETVPPTVPDNLPAKEAFRDTGDGGDGRDAEIQPDSERASEKASEILETEKQVFEFAGEFFGVGSWEEDSK